ncbi:MAG TPA: hypothetical protein VF300_04495 [Methanothrix sp.]
MSAINYDLMRLVRTHWMTLPVIITFPHDDKERPTNVPEREGRPAIKKKSDLHTGDIARGVAQSMLDGTGKTPYVLSLILAGSVTRLPPLSLVR